VVIMRYVSLIVGISVAALSLAIANDAPTLFNTLSTSGQELIRNGFLALSIGGLLIGFIKAF
jgi:hypothetical protein